MSWFPVLLSRGESPGSSVSGAPDAAADDCADGPADADAVASSGVRGGTLTDEVDEPPPEQATAPHTTTASTPPPDAPPPAAPPTRRTRRRRRTADRAGGCDGGVAVGSGLGSLRGVRPRGPGPDPEGGRGGLRRPRPGDVAGLSGHGRGPLRRGDHHRQRRPREIPGQLRRLGRPGPSRRRRLPGDDSDGRRRRSVLEHRGRVHLRGPARHRSRQGGWDLQHNYLYMATLDRSSGSWIVVSDERMGVDQC